MDFVQWCDSVLAKLVEATDGSSDRELYGFMDVEISRAVFGEQTFSPGFSVKWSPLSRQPGARNKLRWAEGRACFSGGHPSRARVAASS